MSTFFVLFILIICIGLAWWGVQAALSVFPAMPPPLKAAIIILFVIAAISVLLSWAGLLGGAWYGGNPRHW
jgi:hypothetical protein